jgi:hypothetical protein
MRRGVLGRAPGRSSPAFCVGALGAMDMLTARVLVPSLHTPDSHGAVSVAARGRG